MEQGDSQARIRPLAATDLEEIVKFPDARSEDAGDRFLQEFFDAATLLASQPGFGSIRRTRGRLKGVRSWPLKKFDSYIIFYLPTSVGIEVIRVLHGARDVDRELWK